MSTLNSPAYRNLSPAQVVAKLADKGEYLAAEKTMYRLLGAHNQVKRRDGTHAPVSRKPRAHVATAPNQVWCWDISYLPGPRRGTYFFLYLVLDLFSRRVMAAQVHSHESSKLAAAMVHAACDEHGVEHGQLVLHSDNGKPMTSLPMIEMLRWLGVAPSFSRPYVSDDNAYAESFFRTAKYRPEFPRGGFSTIDQATAWAADLMRWYNNEHCHSGIGFVTPAQRHCGDDIALLEARRDVYRRARKRHPERWIRNIRTWARPVEVRLNATLPSPAT